MQESVTAILERIEQRLAFVQRASPYPGLSACIAMDLLVRQLAQTLFTTEEQAQVETILKLYGECLRNQLK